MKNTTPHALGTLLVTASLFVTGCGTETSATGNVTYEGQPVAKGYINFIPADGKGPTVGAPIEKGSYSAEGLQPGKKTVQIISVKPVDFATSSAEMARQAEAQGRDFSQLDLIERADNLPEDAVGNNEIHEVKPGHQTLDFALTKPIRIAR